MRNLILFIMLMGIVSSFAGLNDFEEDTLFTKILISEEKDQGQDLEMHDIDGDNDLDLIITSRLRYVTIIENLGNYEFKEHQLIGGLEVNQISIGDLNGDNLPDIAISNTYGSTENPSFYWLENLGNFEFATHTIDTTYQCWRPLVVDIDNDNDNDILMVTAYDDKYILLAENDGKGNFSLETIYSNSYGFYGLNAKDMDNDGDIDIVSSEKSDTSIVILENNGLNEFSRVVVDYDSIGFANISINDINKDGLNDIVACSYEGYVRLYTNEGDLEFSSNQLFYDSSLSFWEVLIEDINNDSLLDIVTTSYGTGDDVGGLFSFVNSGNSEFNSYVIDTSVKLRGAAIGILENGNGPDICAISWNSGCVNLYDNSLKISVPNKNVVGYQKESFKQLNVTVLNNTITVQLGGNNIKHADFFVYNTKGRLIRAFGNRSVNSSGIIIINDSGMRELGNGEYYLKVKTNLGTRIEKFNLN